MKKQPSRRLPRKSPKPEESIGFERPRGIMYVAFYEFIIGILNIFLWMTVILAGLSEGETFIWFVQPLMQAALGVFYIIVGWGFLNLKMWSYPGAIILAIYSILSVAISFFINGGLPISILLNGIVLYYIIRKEVRDVFASQMTGA